MTSMAYATSILLNRWWNAIIKTPIYLS